MKDAPYRLIGTPRFGGILVVSDHASNRVPEDIDLGIDPALLDQHIGTKFGTSTLAQDAMLALIILVVNSLLMYTGRLKLF